MATEYPPLNKIYVFGYSANDRDYPILSATADPRVAGYQVPKDLSACPDKRYPNHVFTGAQPIAGDQRVRHVWEILPSPWVAFTRYDDDLGPVQGRRRSVKNEGQVASLTADKRTTYEAREGSAIVYTELEETWSIATDEDGNSLFPIRDRDFYDSSRGPVQERRQLFVPTGEEEGSLENVNGVITQTSYEPYNEFLSVKIVQTYKVDGPQLIGKATDNEGQLVTITTQRKAALDYVAPNPTATRTVEASREDAESIIERIVDTPQVFDGKILSASKPDVIPEPFRASVPAETTQETVAQNSVSMPVLGADDLEKSEQRVTEFTVRKTTTSRDNGILPTLAGVDYEESFDVGIPFTERIATSIEEGISADISPLGDGKFLVREYDKLEIESSIESFYESYPTRINLNIPRILKSIGFRWDESELKGEQINNSSLIGEFASVTLGDSGQNNADISATPQFDLQLEEINGSNIFATTHLFFVRSPVTTEKILATSGAQFIWPVFKTKSYNLTTNGAQVTAFVEASYSLRIDADPYGAVTTSSRQFRQSRSVTNVVLDIPACIHSDLNVNQSKTVSASPSVSLDVPILGSIPPYSKTISETIDVNISLPSTSPADVPRSGIYLVDSNVEPYKYGFFLVRAVTIDASIFA